jgi:hypothetical protein
MADMEFAEPAQVPRQFLAPPGKQPRDLPGGRRDPQSGLLLAPGRLISSIGHSTTRRVRLWISILRRNSRNSK